MSRSDGGPAFPANTLDVPLKDASNPIYQGMSLRDWFATFAPQPTEEEIKHECEMDRVRNPHGDSYKPKSRSIAQIKAELRYRHAAAMIAVKYQTQNA